MAETKKLLGLRIQEIRKLKGLKQNELAEIVGIDSKHMSKIECGRCYPSFDLLDRIAESLQVEASAFLQDGHLQNRQSLVCEINELLDKSDEKQIQTFYRILKTVTL